jgi:hypothetical protein
MLIADNDRLVKQVDAAHSELKKLRAADLAANACSTLPPSNEACVLHALQRERDDAVRSLELAQAELLSLRTLNQRLMVENSRLIQNPAHPPSC